MSASTWLEPFGAVLSDTEILARSPGEDGKTTGLVTGLRRRQLRPAGYDAAIADDDLVAPDGKEYKGTNKFRGTLYLDPGETAELTSRETFVLPKCVAGTVSIKTRHARRGLLLLTGNIIDPGYEGRLHFYVANVGGRQIELTPDETALAAIQFFRVSGTPTGHAPTGEQAPAHNRSLGFLSLLKDLRDSYSELQADVRRNRSLTDNVLMLGYFVLAATLLSMTMSQILTVGANRDFVRRVDRVIPDSTDGKLLLGVLALSLAWIVYSLAVIVPHRRSPRPDETPDDLFRGEALRELRRDRALQRAWRAVCLVPLATAFVFAVRGDLWAPDWWWIPNAAVVLLLAFSHAAIRGITGHEKRSASYWLLEAPQPLRERDIRRRAQQLAADDMNGDEPSTTRARADGEKRDDPAAAGSSAKAPDSGADA